MSDDARRADERNDRQFQADDIQWIPDRSTYAANSLVNGKYCLVAMNCTVSHGHESELLKEAVNELKATSASLPDTVSPSFYFIAIKDAWELGILLGWYNDSNHEAGWVRIQMQPDTLDPHGMSMSVLPNDLFASYALGNGGVGLIHWVDNSNNNQDIYIGFMYNIDTDGHRDVFVCLGLSRPPDPPIELFPNWNQRDAGNFVLD